MPEFAEEIPANWDGSACLHSAWGCSACRKTWPKCWECGRILDAGDYDYCSMQCEIKAEDRPEQLFDYEKEI